MLPNNAPINAPEFNPMEAMEVMGDAEFDSIIDAMQDAEQQVLLNITSSLVDQLEIHSAEIVAGWCENRILIVEAELADDGTDYGLSEFSIEEREERPGGRTYDEQCEAYVAGADLEYTPSLKVLQDAADARGEPGPLDEARAADARGELGTVDDEFDTGERDESPFAVSARADGYTEEQIEAAHTAGKSEADKIDVLFGDMLDFCFEPDERDAVNAELTATDSWEVMYSSTRAMFLQEIEWTESDLPGGGYDAKERRVLEALGKNVEPDTDYFKIVKGVRDAAVKYNYAVAQAASNAGIKISTEVLPLGMIRVANAKVELAL